MSSPQIVKTHQNHLKPLVKHRLLDPTPESLIQYLEWIIITHVSTMFQRDAVAADQDHTLKNTA